MSPCSRCGTSLKADAPGSLCLACLLSFGLKENETAAPERGDEYRATGDRTGDFVAGEFPNYVVLEKLGEGGGGVVYRAGQLQPVRREVAIKVLKLGMDTRSVIARFEAERQALALMDHPGIARVFDAGATRSGRPFFVMELVRGSRITDYCDTHQLPLAARLELFMEVCRAVQHAHQKGIIHRDLKPANILVANVDGRAQPKVIDFGIAKATARQRLADQTVYTAFDQFIGTPAYMSPEQAGVTGEDVDTRSDIYSLGVLLYELLTGQPPFEPGRLRQAALDEVCRIIREEDPPRPSTRVTSAAPRSGKNPQSARLSKDFSRDLRGDLDCIAMKALEKDRTRRYETASGFAADIGRYLENEPVLARPPSALYQFQKLVGRNKQLFIATAAVIMTLVLGVVFTTWQAFRATKAEQEQSRLRISETELRQQAERAGHAEKTAREQAEMEVGKTRALLRKNYEANAELLSERGDVAGALVWLVEAGKLAADNDLVLKTTQRTIAKTLAKLPPLYHAIHFNTSQPGVARGQPAGTGVFLSPDCRYLATVASGGSRSYATLGKFSHSYVAIRETATGKQKGRNLTMEGEWRDLAFSSDGKLCAVGTTQGVWVYELETGDLKLQLKDGAGAIRLGSDGRHISTLEVKQGWGNFAAIANWRVATGQNVLRFQPGTNSMNQEVFFTAQLSAKGRFAYSQSKENEVLQDQIRDLHGGQTFQIDYNLEYYQTNLGISEIGAVAFSPEEDLVACRHKTGQLRVIDLQSGKILPTPAGFPGNTYTDSFRGAGAEFSPDSSRLITWGDDAVVRIWDTIAWEPIGEPLKPAAKLQRVVFSPDGQDMVTVSSQRKLQLWDVKTGKALTSPFSIPPDATSEQLRSLDLDERWDPFDLRFSPDGTFLVVGRSDAVWVWKVFAEPADPAEPQSLRDMEILAQFWSGRSLDANGGLQRLTGPAAGTSWESWRVLNTRQFPSAPAQLTLSFMHRGPTGRQKRSALNWGVARPPQTPVNLIDLSPWYNQNLHGTAETVTYQHNLIGLTAGIQKLDGVEFDVRGIIQLSGQGLAGSFPSAAQARHIKGIPVNQKGERIHALHGTSFDDDDGVEIASLMLHYVDGQHREIPIIYGRDVRDYWFDAGQPEITTNAVVVWTGSNEQTKSRGKNIRLFKSSWDNPLPDVRVESLDYVSRMSGASPFLIGLTVE